MNYLKVALVLLLIEPVKSQTATELFISPDYSGQEILFGGSAGDSSKVSFFSYTRFIVNYQRERPNEFLNYSAVNYDILKGLGLAVGGFAAVQGFSSFASITYFYQNDRWAINVFKSAELRPKPNIELFALVQHRQRISKNWSLFTQLILTSNFNFRHHNFSEQTFRVGLDNHRFQFGVRTDLRQITSARKNETNTVFNHVVGLFLRKEF
ncbi:MAG: hypothetical protein KF846_07805 [Cyclobacteriaceae bacterium]|nr:hypothetical protein [Cyclobacteriaceae bacterium]